MGSQISKPRHLSQYVSALWVTGGIVVLISWPLFAHMTPISTTLATEIVILSLFAMAYNLALGYTGLVSLGHAAFFGVGGYTTGALLKFLHAPVLVALLGGTLVAGVVGAVMGYICLRKTGVYFTLVTLAISQMFYYVAQMWIPITGGNEGMVGIPRLSLWPGLELTSNATSKYWFVATVSVASTYILWKVVNSSFGRVLQAIRENEQRAATCGFNTPRVKHVSVIISSIFSGVAGSLYIIFLEFFGIENIYWTMSGTVLIVTLFGGTGVFLGPLVGAFLFLLMKDSLSHYFEYWQMITGAIFILIVLFLPEGILGSAIKIWGRFQRKGLG